jgi:pyruvate dehydrogenase E2 component (dihydrolipoamide acetyltransferase)
LLDKLNRPDTRANLRRYLAANFSQGQAVGVEPVAWARIAAPVQLIWGTDDTIIAPPPPFLVPETLPSHRLDNVGHMPHIAAATAVNALIAAFVSRQ